MSDSPARLHPAYDGAVVVVTGGTRGIGAGIAERFMACGASVVVCGRRRPETELRVGRRMATFVEADVREPAQIEALVARTVADFGRLDVWVNNAGGTPLVDPVSASPRFHQAIIELNLTAPLNSAMAAFKVMRDQDHGGTILFISSVSANIGGPRVPAYSAAKAGLNNLVGALAGTFAPRVRVNAVEVGLVATPDSGDFYGAIEDLESLVPMGRLCTPADVGNACLLLADPGLGGFITGAVLACHGGRPLAAPER